MSSAPLTRRNLLALAAGLALGGARPARSQDLLTLDAVAVPFRKASPLADWILARSLGGPARVRTPSGEVAFGRFDGGAFVRRRPSSELVEAGNVLVHESCHYLNPVLALEQDPRAMERRGTVALVVAPGKVLLVPGQPVFPSREAADGFPAFLQKSQRFATYVSTPQDAMVTQQYGVFGLLGELAAYHAGTRSALDLVRHLARSPEGAAEEWVAHLCGVDATVIAWPELRGYLLAWLAWGRVHRVEVYRRVVDEPAFRAGWRAVDGAFGEVCRAWYRELPGFLDRLRRSGRQVDLRGDFLVAGRRGRRLFRREYEATLAGLREDPRFQEVERALARP